MKKFLQIIAVSALLASNTFGAECQQTLDEQNNQQGLTVVIDGDEEIHLSAALINVSRTLRNMTGDKETTELIKLPLDFMTIKFIETLVRKETTAEALKVKLQISPTTKHLIDLWEVIDFLDIELPINNPGSFNLLDTITDIIAGDICNFETTAREAYDASLEKNYASERPSRLGTLANSIRNQFYNHKTIPKHTAQFLRKTRALEICLVKKILDRYLIDNPANIYDGRLDPSVSSTLTRAHQLSTQQASNTYWRKHINEGKVLLTANVFSLGYCLYLLMNNLSQQL
jgi:hypothetical protein